MPTRNVPIISPAASHHTVWTSFYRSSPERPDAGTLHVVLQFPTSLGGGESIDIAIANADGTAIAPFTQPQANSIATLLGVVFTRALSTAGYT